MTKPTYSIGVRLLRRIMLQTALCLGCLCVGIYWATQAQFAEAQERAMTMKVSKLVDVASERLYGDGTAYVELMQQWAQRRPGTRLEIWHEDGTAFYRDPGIEPNLLSKYTRSRAFTLKWTDGSKRDLQGRYTVDISDDARMLHSVAVILVLATLLGSIAVSISAYVTVQRGLRPLRDLAIQTNSISTKSLHTRLETDEPVAELQPLVTQFNALMDRVELAYRQLESFNADVAHELRTPLTALIGQTEVSLSRLRTAKDLSEVLQSNLEELIRMSDIVSDMLFLSKADRGALARRGAPQSLAVLAKKVVEFHEASLENANVSIHVDGDAIVSIDEALFKRALSNLVDNATRFAEPGSVIRIYFAERSADEVVTMVENKGPAIKEEYFARLFDRFFRVDSSRKGSNVNHGLGLAIVAAIARMHGGCTSAGCGHGLTRISFSIMNAEAEKFEKAA